MERVVMVIDTDFMRKLPYKLGLSFRIVSKSVLDQLKISRDIEICRELEHDLDNSYANGDGKEIKGDDYVAVYNRDVKGEYAIVEIVSSTNIRLDGSRIKGDNGAFSYKDFFKLDLNNLDISGTKSLHGLFKGSTFNILDLRPLVTGHIEDFSYLLHEVNAKEIIGIEDMDTSSAVDMGHMFSEQIIDVGKQLRNFKTHNVKSMIGMFEHCTLINCDFRGFDTSKVKYFDGMFRMAHFNGNIELSSFNTECGVSFRDMFDSCKSDSILDVSGFVFNKDIIESNCIVKKYSPLYDMLSFGGTIKVSKELYDISLTYDYGICNNSSAYIQLDSNDNQDILYLDRNIIKYLPENIHLSFKSVNKNIWNKLRGRVISLGNDYILHDDYMIIINDKQYYKIVSYKKISLRDNILSADMQGVFREVSFISLDLHNVSLEGCRSLASLFYEAQINDLDISSLDTSNIEDMSCMFYGAHIVNSLKGLNKLNTGKVKKMAYMFNDSVIKDIDISNFNTINVKDMSYMFSRVSLGRIKGLDKLDVRNVTSMRGMFKGYSVEFDCINLRSWNTCNLRDMGCMFSNIIIKNIEYINHLCTSKVEYMTDLFKNSTCNENFSFDINIGSLKDCADIFDNFKCNQLLIDDTKLMLLKKIGIKKKKRMFGERRRINL